jgi:hypothetical protein
LAVAGEPNESRRELWTTTIRRSFQQPDGLHRIQDILNNLYPVEVDDRTRHKVYPGEDDRVIRVVTKVVRGLSDHHGIMTAVPESRVWVDVMRYRIPDAFLSEITAVS